MAAAVPTRVPATCGLCLGDIRPGEPLVRTRNHPTRHASCPADRAEIVRLMQANARAVSQQRAATECQPVDWHWLSEAVEHGDLAYSAAHLLDAKMRGLRAAA